MASRLSRWGWTALIGAAVVVGVLLPPGDTPLLIGYGVWPTETTDRLEVRKEALDQALDRTEWELARAQEAQQLGPLLHFGGDPTALMRDRGGVHLDPVATRELEAVWRSLPVRSPNVRTVILFDRLGRIRRDLSDGPRSEGVCFLRLGAKNQSPVRNSVHTQGGECLFSELFGPPGKGLKAWFDSLPVRGVEWDVSIRGMILRDEADRSVVAQPWFARGYGSYLAYGGWVWGPRGRSYAACLAGRGDQCRTSFGVDGSWASSSGRSAFSSDTRWVPVEALPRALLTELGPERFVELWRADDPLGTAYAKVTGRPIDDWLLQWSHGRSGRFVQDIALSTLAWFGVMLWLLLLGAWNLIRLKVRAVT